MIMPIAMLVICTFVGGADYECDPSESFDSMESCEEISSEITEAKGLRSYCIEIDESDHDWDS